MYYSDQLNEDQFLFYSIIFYTKIKSFYTASILDLLY